MTRLDGHVAFVTGAGGGIGSAVCERFLAEGARVAALDINLDGARRAVEPGLADGRALAVECDAGDTAQVRDAIARTAETFGRINSLCLIAGGSSARDDVVTEAPEEEFWRVMRLDVFGTFIACKFGIPQLIRAGGGSVITFSSMTALMGVPGRDCYTPAKGAVAALTRSMAATYGRDGVRVNAIAPGITYSQRVREAVAGSEALQALAARSLLGPAEPVDIAHMAVYLASDESRVVTGQVLAVDSGITVH
jgi:NAD(P)-dependent dehydrogenase (short-subunit alcohol dehydrogenase family)